MKERKRESAFGVATFDTFLDVSKDLNDLTSTERSFHNLAPLYEKHLWPKADLQRGTAKSVLVLRSYLLHASDSLANISVR